MTVLWKFYVVLGSWCIKPWFFDSFCKFLRGCCILFVRHSKPTKFQPHGGLFEAIFLIRFQFLVLTLTSHLAKKWRLLNADTQMCCLSFDNGNVFSSASDRLYHDTSNHLAVPWPIATSAVMLSWYFSHLTNVEPPSGSLELFAVRCRCDSERAVHF